MPDEIMFLAEGIEAAITSTNGVHSNYSYPGFAVDNLLDRNKNTPWKSNLSGDVYIKVDLGSLIDVKYLALIGCNPYTGGSYDGTKWRLQVSKMTSWTAGSSDITGILVPTASNEPFWLVDCTDCNSRYFQFNLKETVQGTSKVGTILLGTPYKSDLPYNRPRPMRSSYGIDVRETKGGHRHSNLRFEDRKIWRRADFDVLTEEDWDDLFQYLWQASKGGHYPCLFRDVDDSLNWIRVNAGSGNLDYQESLNHFFQAPFVFEQEF
jgi:hypothetical protein